MNALVYLQKVKIMSSIIFCMVPIIEPNLLSSNYCVLFAKIEAASFFRHFFTWGLMCHHNSHIIYQLYYLEYYDGANYEAWNEAELFVVASVIK